MTPRPRATQLTDVQERILEFIRHSHSSSGVFPTIREIAEYMDFKSTNTVDYHLKRLEASGALERPGRRARSYVVAEDGQDAPAIPRRAAPAQRTEASPGGIPLVGRVAAGEPILAEQNLEEYVHLEGWMRADDQTYALQVRGDSMIDAGINDGDLVIVRSQQRVDNGQIGVAVLGDEATVKRIYDEGDRYRLQPENPVLQPRFVTKDDPDFRIGGRVVGIVRRL